MWYEQMNPKESSIHGTGTNTGISSGYSSSRSKQYEINTSGIFTSVNRFKISSDFSHDDFQMHSLFCQFSLDIGRYDLKFRIFNSFRVFIYPLYLIFSACGFILIDTTKLNSLISKILEILTYLEIFLPEDLSFSIKLLFNLLLLIIYFSLVLYLFHILSRYKQRSCITEFEMIFFIIISRTILPIFTTYISHLFSHSLYQLIFFTQAHEPAAFFIISLPLLIIQIIYIVLSCGAYNATPIIRKHDIAQVWFSQSVVDWQINLLIFLQICFQTIILFLNKSAASIVFLIVELIIGVCFSLLIFQRLPFILPITNSIFLATAISTPFCSLCPIISHYSPSGMTYYMVILVILIILSFFLSKFLINYRLQSILKRFEVLHDQINDTSAKGLIQSFQQNENDQYMDFDLLNIKDEGNLSLLTRVGFLFNEPLIINSHLIRHGIEINGKADFILSAIQVMYAIRKDEMILTSLYQGSLKILQGPFNMHSFIELFNILRQDVLTQLNQPLLEAISTVKQANKSLQHSISEFWGAVLKQKLDSLLLLLPEISDEAIKTERLYLRLARNHKKATTVYKELALFYHQSMGDHIVANQYQAKFDKARTKQKNNAFVNEQYNNFFSSSSSSSSSTSLSENSSMSQFNPKANSTPEPPDLNEFHDRLENYRISQESIMSIPLPPLKWMYATINISFILIFVLPSVILGISLSEMRRFSEAFAPIQTVGELETIITRIPQLIRRRNLLEVDDILPIPPEVGAPKYVHNEFISNESIDFYLNVYYNLLVNNSNTLLDLCSETSVLTAACNDHSHSSYFGDSVFSATVFDLLSSYETSLQLIINNKDFNWANASESSSFIYLMRNFDTLYATIHSMAQILIREINNQKTHFKKLAMIFLILAWVAPIVIIIPLTIIMVYLFKREVVYELKMFFQIPKSEISELRNAIKEKHMPAQQGFVVTNQPAADNNNAMRSQATQSQLSLSTYDMVSTNNNNQTTTTTSTNWANDDLVDSLATFPRKITGVTGSFLYHLFIVVLFNSIFTTIGIVVYQQSTLSLIDMSSVYVSSINVYSSTLASYVWTQELFSEQPLFYDRAELKRKSLNYTHDLISLFDGLLFGVGSYHLEHESKAALILGNDVLDLLLQSASIPFNNTFYTPSFGLAHVVYLSLSCEAQVRVFSTISELILSEDCPVNFSFRDDFVYHYEHLLFSHLDLDLNEAMVFFNAKTDELNENKTDELIMIFSIMFLIQFLYFITFVVNSFYILLEHLKRPRYLLLLTSPTSLLKSQSLMKWISGTLNSTYQTHSNEINVNKGIDTDFVTLYTKCGIAIASSDLKIEKVNRAFLLLFQKKEFEVIGLNFLTFLKHNLIEKNKRGLLNLLSYEVRRMQDGTSPTYKHQLTSSILGLNSHLIRVKIVIEGLLNGENDDSASGAKSFSIRINDETVQYTNELLIEKEKERSEQLISALIPASISKKLSQGETDVSFQVQESTIMFASIDKWSTLLTSLNSAESFAFINNLFSMYDQEMANFEHLTKLRAIGNVYMVCGGLYDNGTINSAHIVLNYALKILSEAKQINSPAFDIKIGIHTGGPINCGIVGKDMPLFDIIGEPINIAFELNKRGSPGFIQISEATYNNIKFMNYNIQENGEIFIKGESTKTFLVSINPFPNEFDTPSIFPIETGNLDVNQTIPEE